MTRILILDGHPDPAPQRFIHVLADAYQEGARAGQHEVLVVRLADVQFPLLRTQADYERGEPGEAVRQCQGAIDWANHVIILYPLWLGCMPALLKALLEQTLRPGFAFSTRKLGRWPVKLQSGKTARIVVTMGMPAFVYRWFYRAHGVRSLKRNILQFRWIPPHPYDPDRRHRRDEQCGWQAASRTHGSSRARHPITCSRGQCCNERRVRLARHRVIPLPREP